MTGTDSRTGEITEVETETSPEVETEIPTGIMTEEVAGTEITVGTETDSPGAQTGETSGHETETGHSQETGITKGLTETETVRQETEGEVVKGDRKNQQEQTMPVLKDIEQTVDKERQEKGVTVGT
jgi:hypothetical protein